MYLNANDLWYLDEYQLPLSNIALNVDNIPDMNHAAEPEEHVSPRGLYSFDVEVEDGEGPVFLSEEDEFGAFPVEGGLDFEDGNSSFSPTVTTTLMDHEEHENSRSEWSTEDEETPQVWEIEDIRGFARRERSRGQPLEELQDAIEVFEEMQWMTHEEESAKATIDLIYAVLAILITTTPET